MRDWGKTKSHLSMFPVNAVLALLLGALFIGASHWAVLEKEYPFWHTLLHEVGFALIVAVVIWGAFEFFTRADTEEGWNRRIEAMAKNVFLGVYRRNFPPALIAEANKLVLEKNFIREGLNITYTLVDASFKNRLGQDQMFVKLHAVARFKVKNVGEDAAILPIGIGLPNPLIDEMKDACRVHRITIKRNGKEDRPELAHAERKFREDLKDDTQHQVNFSIEGVTVQANEEVEVVFDYVMAKEDQDTEVFQTRLPADGLIITVVDQGPTKRVVRARSIHFAGLENDTSSALTGTYNFKLSHYLLPHQGFAVWWKNVPPGAPEAAIGVGEVGPELRPTHGSNPNAA